MKQKHPHYDEKSAENRQLAHILSVIIWASWGTYLFVILAGVYFNDRTLISVTLIGSVLLFIPFVLLRRGHLQGSSLIVVLVELATATFIAVVGQGIRDVAIVTFPIILFFAGLTLSRAQFRVCVGLTLSATSALVIGEFNGWFVSKPFIGTDTNWFYLIFVTIILLVAALAVDLLATNMRKNMDLAQQEITQRKLAEEEVEIREKRFHALIKHGRDNISLLAADATLLWENPSTGNTLGYAPQQFVGSNIFEIMHPDDQARTRGIYARVVQSPGNIEEGEFRLRHADGTWRWIECSAANLLEEPGVQAIVLNYRDITTRKQAEKTLQEKEVQYRNLADAGIALIWASGLDKLCNYFNQPWLKFTGRTLEQEMGNGWAEGVHPDDFARCLETYITAFDKQEAFEMDYRLRHASGEYRWIQDIGTPNYSSNHEFVGYIGHCFDISERKWANEQLRYQGTHDGLTGIYNRSFFEEELARFGRGRDFPVSIIIADIDGLKYVNDTLGHTAGDELLRQAARVLSSIFRTGDVLARIGGDEFAALLPATDAEAATLIVSRIRERLEEYNSGLAALPVQLSIGAATAEKNNLTETFTLADQRMYADKSARKSSVNPATG